MSITGCSFSFCCLPSNQEPPPSPHQLQLSSPKLELRATNEYGEYDKVCTHIEAAIALVFLYIANIKATCRFPPRVLHVNLFAAVHPPPRC